MSLRHISGWVDITGPEGPIDPGYGRPGGGGPVDPGWGVRPPVDPGYGIPDIGGGHVDNDLPGLGHVWGAFIRWLTRPQVGGGPAKPPGYPTLPIDPGGRPPDGTHPWLPGHWVPVDPGWGQSPIFGWKPIDPGFGVGGGGGGTLPANPGHWVPIDPGYGIPVGPCGGEKPPHVWGHPVWVWIQEIGPDIGKPKPLPPGGPEPKK